MELRFTFFERASDGASRSEAALWNFIQDRGSELGAFLRTCEGFAHLSFQDALELALSTRLREAESGEIIYGIEDSEAGSAIFILFRGSVVLERASGGRHKEIDCVRSSEFFGGLPIIAGCRPIERAVATERSTLLEFSCYQCEYLMNSKPILGARLIRAASYHWTQRVVNFLDQTFSQSSIQ